MFMTRNLLKEYVQKILLEKGSFLGTLNKINPKDLPKMKEWLKSQIDASTNKTDITHLVHLLHPDGVEGYLKSANKPASKPQGAEKDNLETLLQKSIDMFKSKNKNNDDDLPMLEPEEFEDDLNINMLDPEEWGGNPNSSGLPKMPAYAPSSLKKPALPRSDTEPRGRTTPPPLPKKKPSFNLAPDGTKPSVAQNKKELPSFDSRKRDLNKTKWEDEIGED